MIDDDKRLRHEDLPKCACFEDDDKMRQAVSCSMAAAVSQVVGHVMLQGCQEANLCKEAMPYVMELCIISMATIVGVANTAIELGSQEAEWETDRVLTGIEERVRKRLKQYYAETRRLGITRESIEAHMSGRKQ